MTYMSAIKFADEPGRIAALYRYEILDTDPEQEFQDITKLVRTLFNVPIAAISLVDVDRQWFKAIDGLGISETPRSVAFCDYTLRSADPVAVEDATQDPRFVANPLVTGAPAVRCYLGVPLTTPEGYNLGSLCVIGTEPRSFSPADEQVLASFARLVVSQMELRMEARRDMLTGALTRRAFSDALQAAAEEAAAGEAPASLILFDIDHFKYVNDRWGHPAGDEVLRAVSEAIVCELRPADRLGRLGGEEFGVLAQVMEADEALALAERVRQAVAALRVPCLQGHAVTVSGGVASWHPSRPDQAEWVAAADVALYTAKRSGRNRIVEAFGSLLHAT
ncbi:MAG TPA: sensor domain-containing diguanylate cyclase [Rubellimicrobium sp.]|nr:sensor domain-containing diguanylate cyclase [Rubellimicrobium sp.]